MRLEEAFNKNYNRFTENEQYICRYLLEHKKECAVMSITEFAGSCHVSESMLVRFAKKNGLAGYGELKARLRLEEQETEEALGPGEELLNTVTDSYHKMMDELIGRGLDSLFEKLYRGSAQTRAASEMKRIFLPVKEMFHIHGHDMRGALSRVMTERDMAVIISLTGESEATVSLARELRLRQVPTLSITRLGNNTLASVCDENLYIHSITLPSRYGVEYEISTPYFILIEYLYLAYQEFLKRRLDSL
mgnify:FL=1